MIQFRKHKKVFMLVAFLVVVSIVVILMIFIKVQGPVSEVEQAKRNLSYQGFDIPVTHLCTQSGKRCNPPAGAHPCCVDHLAQMLDDLTSQMGPKIFIHRGTLLAWRRYHGNHMIPHDDDLDVGMLAKHEKDLIAAIPALEKLKYIVQLKEGHEKINGTDLSSNDRAEIEYPPYRYYVIRYSDKNDLHLDITVLASSQMIDGTPVLVDGPQIWADKVPTMSMYNVKKYKMWIYPTDMILPLESIKYLDVVTYKPNKVDSLLEYIYGPTFMTPDGFNTDDPVSRLIKTLDKDKYNNDDIGMGPIFIVNLDGDIERLHHLLTQCKEEEIYATRAGNCCDRTLTDLENKRFEYNKYFRSDLGEGQKKCFLSHEMCWKEIAEQTKPCMVVEDDVAFPINVKRILNRIITDLNKVIKENIVPKATVVRLGIGSFNYISRLGLTCLATSSFATGAWAYIVTPEAAKALLSVSKQDKLQWPADHFFNVPIIKNINETIMWETRLPPEDQYMFLDIAHDVFEPIRYRYVLNNDKTRKQVIQELSTELGSSRSSQISLLPLY
jgi:GR25 family glycosyltransferase involved in LPS biosynthesis